jgi:hypothetical protein
VDLGAVILEEDMTQPRWNLVGRFEGGVGRSDMK